MKLLASCLFASALAAAQSLTLDAGAPGDQYYSAGSVAYTIPAGAPPGLATLRYGPSFTYAIPLANGSYTVALTFVEPNKTAAGQRVFTVTENGQTSPPLDVFMMAGLLKPFTLTMSVPVTTGTLTLSFVDSAGVNALVSVIALTPALGGPCATTDGSLALFAKLADGTCLPVIFSGSVLGGSGIQIDIRQPESTPVTGEIPAGSIDGTNAAFTLAAVPAPASVALYSNGLRLMLGVDYSISGNAITFLPVGIPEPGDLLQADYRH